MSKNNNKPFSSISNFPKNIPIRTKVKRRFTCPNTSTAISLNSKITYLLCPKCKKEIPSISKYIIAKFAPYEISISISCKNCNLYNQIYSLNDCALQNETPSFIALCPLHDKKKLLYHCVQCNSNICEQCSSETHKEHKKLTHSEYYKDIDFKLPFHSTQQLEEYTNELLSENEKLKKEVLKKIYKKILELSDIKKLIEDTHQKNIDINYKLSSFIKLLYSNYLKNNNNIQIVENFNTICQLNKNKLDNSPKINHSLELLSAELISYYNTNFIIHPYHIFDKIIYDNQEHKSSINCLIQLSTHNNPLMTGSIDKTIKIWDVHSSYKCIQTLTGHTRAINILTELKNGNVASGSSDNTIIIWSIETYQKITKIHIHTSFIFGIIQLTDNRIITVSDDRHLYVWGEDLQVIGDNKFEREIFCVCQIESEEKERRKIAVGLGDSVIWLCFVNNRYFDTISKEPLKGHTGSIRTLFMLKDGRLLSGSNDNTIRVWDVIKKICLFVLEEHYLYINDIIQLKDGRVVSTAFDDTIKFWNVNTFKCITTFKGHRSSNAIIELIDGRIATGSSDSFLSLWN